MERAKPLSGKGVVENRCGAKLDVQRTEAAVCFRGHTPPASRLEYAIAAVRDHSSPLWNLHRSHTRTRNETRTGNDRLYHSPSSLHRFAAR